MINNKFKVNLLRVHMSREAPGTLPQGLSIVQKATGVQERLQLKGMQAVNLEVVKERDPPRVKEAMEQLAPCLETSIVRMRLRKRGAQFKCRRPRKRAAQTRSLF